MKEHKFEHAREAEIKLVDSPDDIRIYINDILHFYIRRTELISLQSWYVSKNYWCIEITTTTKNINLAYNSLHKWQTILKLLSEAI